MPQVWNAIKTPQVLSFAVFSTMLAVAGAATAELPEPHQQDGRIGFVLTERHWAIYETEASTECPQGMNRRGSRDLFAQQFPEDSNVERTVVDTRLMIEAYQYHTNTATTDIYGSLPYYEAQGNVSYGLNLDGEVSADDFRNPAGEEGIDNQLYRALGCITGYRNDGQYWLFENSFMINNGSNRWMIELSGVDDLVNDDDVTVTTYRGLDNLLADGTGEGFSAGGTQRVDARWGQSFVEEVKGKIVDGVLTTEPIAQAKIPWSQPGVLDGYHIFKDLQFQLKLTSQVAQGLMGGYVDIEQYNHRFRTSWSSHHQNYGQSSSASEYTALKRLADAYPDPETGANTAISGAVEVTLTQVYIVHPDE
ncbi:hypothetical protein N8303_07790 [Gammaproteobacteria bacterium]|nr:hypothetical protein [Gammaproteobacteria bacterium]